MQYVHATIHGRYEMVLYHLYRLARDFAQSAAVDRSAIHSQSTPFHDEFMRVPFATIALEARAHTIRSWASWLLRGAHNMRGNRAPINMRGNRAPIRAFILQAPGPCRSGGRSQFLDQWKHVARGGRVIFLSSGTALVMCFPNVLSVGISHRKW